MTVFQLIDADFLQRAMKEARWGPQVMREAGIESTAPIPASTSAPAIAVEADRDLNDCKEVGRWLRYQ